LSAGKSLNSLTFVRKKDISSDKKVQLRGSKKRLVRNFLSFLSQLFLYIKFNLEIACLLWWCYLMFSMVVLFHDMSLVAETPQRNPSTWPSMTEFTPLQLGLPWWSSSILTPVSVPPLKPLLRAIH